MQEDGTIISIVCRGMAGMKQSQTSQALQLREPCSPCSSSTTPPKCRYRPS